MIDTIAYTNRYIDSIIAGVRLQFGKSPEESLQYWVFLGEKDPIPFTRYGRKPFWAIEGDVPVPESKSLGKRTAQNIMREVSSVIESLTPVPSESLSFSSHCLEIGEEGQIYHYILDNNLAKENQPAISSLLRRFDRLIIMARREQKKIQAEVRALQEKGQKVYRNNLPKKCPHCGYPIVATILYGMPVMDERMIKDLNTGLYSLGGCVIFNEDPSWFCQWCGLPIYRPEGPMPG